MTTTIASKRSIGIWVFSLLAFGFGLLTIKSGGAVLFGIGEARQAAGNYVPFVLWFNFSAGFFYVIAAIALWYRQSWVTWLALTLAITTLAIFAFFGLHILNGGEYEMRTVIAMILRSVVWIIITVFTLRYFR